MIMPTGGAGINIFYLLCAWASLLMTHAWWKENYEVACVVSEKNVDGDAIGALLGLELQKSDAIHIINNDPKQTILTLERELHCHPKPKGLLVLAGEKLSMGVSLPCTDVVFLLNEKKSPDDIIQKMYRALTPSPGKKAAFIVDLNPVRTLAALYGYTRASHESTNTTSKLLDIIYDTYSWDSDIFEYNLKKGSDAKPLSFQERLRQLFEMAEKDTDGVYKLNEDIGGLEKKLGNNVRRGLNSEFISKVAGQFGSKKMEAVVGRIGLKEGSKITLEKGKLVIRVPTEPVALVAGEEAPATESIEIVIDNFIETVADFVKYLALTSSSNTLEGALEEYESPLKNEEGSSLRQNVLHMVRSRTDIREGQDEGLLSRLLLAAVNIADSSSKQVFRQMKGKIDEKTLRKDKILAIINKRLTPRQKQKKDHGEVFTPIGLIEDMLSHLPKSDWSNPDLKWLDPANGIGNFPVVVFYKLDEGLKSLIPNETKRKKHIIEKMIFMMELQSNNNRIAKNIFTSLCDGCTPNIWTVDSLKATNEQIVEHFGVDGFDRVIGNPPFQAFQAAEGKRGGGDELYMKFVQKSIELLKPNGYLIFVHPPSWRKPEFSEGRKKSKNVGMFDLMAHQNQIMYLEIHDSKDGMETFKAGTRYDFYVLKKTKAHETSRVKDIYGNLIEIDLRDFNFLPNASIKNVKKLFPTGSDESCSLGSCVLYERSAYGSDKSWVSQTESATFKYPLVHSTPQDGPRIYYSNTKDKGFFGIPKVIFGDSAINEPIIDIDGKYGMTQHAMAIVVKNEADAKRLAKFLKSNFFKNVLSACMYSGFQIDWRIFTYFKNNFWNEDVDVDEKLLVSEKVAELVEGGGARSSIKHRFSKTRKAQK